MQCKEYLLVGIMHENDLCVQMARSKKACLVFFDEIDAIGGARFDDGAGAHLTHSHTSLRCGSRAMLTWHFNHSSEPAVNEYEHGLQQTLSANHRLVSACSSAPGQ